ncbi:hypothetical protein Scep_023323 [Stephania cephalantha]|uniref:Selenoprotein H n=1 Tax=Stephania cephalantha TaxID=152367 RepID=A0AAP0F1J3_9MAGN
MAPKRKGREPVESTKKVGKARKARSSTGPSSEKPRAAASPTRRVTRRSNPVLVESPLEALPDIPRKKKARKAAQEKGKSVPSKVNDASTDDLTTEATRKIIVEFCKQCNSFKTRATQVKAGLESGLSGIEVVLNPEKGMKRPFKDLKAVNINELVSDILKKLK